MEDHAGVRIADEDAVEKSDVEMNVQVQAAKSLHEVDRTALPILDSQALGVCAIPREDGIDCDATDRRQHLRLEGGQLAQFVGQGQDVLPHGHVGQNPVHDGRRRIGHASSGAAGAHRSRFAGEGDEKIVTTCIAPRANEAL